MAKNRLHGNLIPEINLNSKIFNPKAQLKGNQLEENRFLQDLKYQYVEKLNQDRKIYRDKKKNTNLEEEMKKGKNRASAGFLMLYKKSLDHLSKHYQEAKDIKNSNKVDAELARTDGLTIDESLNRFAKDHAHIVNNLMLMEASDFNRPIVKQMLREAQQEEDESRLTKKQYVATMGVGMDKKTRSYSAAPQIHSLHAKSAKKVVDIKQLERVQSLFESLPNQGDQKQKQQEFQSIMKHFVGGNKFSKIDEIEQEQLKQQSAPTSHLKRIRENTNVQSQSNLASGSGLVSRASQENVKQSKQASMHTSVRQPQGSVHHGLASRGSSQLTHHTKHGKQEVIDTFKIEKPKTVRSQQELSRIEQYNYLVKSHDERKGIQDLQTKLKALILSRINDKELIASNQGISQLMNDIKETKMAIENELDDILNIKAAVAHSNQFSQEDTQKAEIKLKSIYEKMAYFKAQENIHAELLNKMNNGEWTPMQEETKAKGQVEHNKNRTDMNKLNQPRKEHLEQEDQAQKQTKFHMKEKDEMKAMKENQRNGVLQRVSNKDQKVFEQIIKFYGKDVSQQEEYLAFIERFKDLRGDYGFKQDKALLEKIHPDVGKLHKELMARRERLELKAAEEKMAGSSHGMFMNTAEYNKSLKKSTKAEEEALQHQDQYNRNAGAGAQDSVKTKRPREPTADEYFDMIPDEPFNRDACAQKKVLFENYSYNKCTGTIPAQRVKLDGCKKYKTRVKSAIEPWKRANSNYREGLVAYETAIRNQARPNSKTPIMAQRYYMRQDLVNKNIISGKGQQNKRQPRQDSPSETSKIQITDQHHSQEFDIVTFDQQSASKSINLPNLAANNKEAILQQPQPYMKIHSRVSQEEMGKSSDATSKITGTVTPDHDERNVQKFHGVHQFKQSVFENQGLTELIDQTPEEFQVLERNNSKTLKRVLSKDVSDEKLPQKVLLGGQIQIIQEPEEQGQDLNKNENSINEALDQRPSARFSNQKDQLSSQPRRGKVTVQVEGYKEAHSRKILSNPTIIDHHTEKTTIKVTNSDSPRNGSMDRFDNNGEIISPQRLEGTAGTLGRLGGNSQMNSPDKESTLNNIICASQILNDNQIDQNGQKEPALKIQENQDQQKSTEDKDVILSQVDVEIRNKMDVEEDLKKNLAKKKRNSIDDTAKYRLDSGSMIDDDDMPMMISRVNFNVHTQPKPSNRIIQSKKPKQNTNAYQQMRMQQPRAKHMSPDSNQIKEMIQNPSNAELLNMLELTNDNQDLEVSATLDGNKKDCQKVKSPQHIGQSYQVQIDSKKSRQAIAFNHREQLQSDGSNDPHRLGPVQLHGAGEDYSDELVKHFNIKTNLLSSINIDSKNMPKLNNDSAQKGQMPKQTILVGQNKNMLNSVRHSATKSPDHMLSQKYSNGKLSQIDENNGGKKSKSHAHSSLLNTNNNSALEDSAQRGKVDEYANRMERAKQSSMSMNVMIGSQTLQASNRDLPNQPIISSIRDENILIEVRNGCASNPILAPNIQRLRPKSSNINNNKAKKPGIFENQPSATQLTNVNDGSTTDQQLLDKSGSLTRDKSKRDHYFTTNNPLLQKRASVVESSYESGTVVQGAVSHKEGQTLRTYNTVNSQMSNTQQQFNHNTTLKSANDGQRLVSRGLKTKQQLMQMGKRNKNSSVMGHLSNHQSSADANFFFVVQGNSSSLSNNQMSKNLSRVRTAYDRGSLEKTQTNMNQSISQYKTASEQRDAPPRPQTAAVKAFSNSRTAQKKLSSVGGIMFGNNQYISQKNLNTQHISNQHFNQSMSKDSSEQIFPGRQSENSQALKVRQFQMDPDEHHAALRNKKQMNNSQLTTSLQRRRVR